MENTKIKCTHNGVEYRRGLRHRLLKNNALDVGPQTDYRQCIGSVLQIRKELLYTLIIFDPLCEWLFLEQWSPPDHIQEGEISLTLTIRAT